MRNASLKIYNRLTESIDYSDNLGTFNQILTEWDFIQQYTVGDVTSPYISNVTIDGDNITVSCEIWDPDTDDFVSCDGGTFESPEIIKMIKEANFDSTANVYEEAQPIYQALSRFISWDEVSKELYKLRDEELKDMNESVEEEEEERKLLDANDLLNKWIEMENDIPDFADKWNSCTGYPEEVKRQRIKLVNPTVVEFVNEYADDLKANWEEFSSLMTDDNYHTPLFAIEKELSKYENI